MSMLKVFCQIGLYMIVWWDGMMKLKKSKVNCACENIKTSLPEGWAQRIERETMKVGDWGFPEMYVLDKK